MPIERVAIIGLGLLGGSVGMAVQERLPAVRLSGFDADPAVRQRAAERGLVHTVTDNAADAVRGADLVILCVPVGAMRSAAKAIAPGLFHTPMMEGLPPDVAAKITANVPFPARLGDPAEFGRLVADIVLNPYLNGTVIRLDGAVRLPPR